MTDHPTTSGPVAPRVRRVRVSHAERADTVSRLQHALVEGRLDFTETDERVTAAFAARYDSELQLLLVDLPPHVPASSRGAVVERSVGVGRGGHASSCWAGRSVATVDRHSSSAGPLPCSRYSRWCGCWCVPSPAPR